MTYKHSMQLDWLQTELESMSSAGDSLAKTSALQARGQDLPGSAAASGTSSTGSSTKLSRATRLLKTYQPFGLKDWTTYSGRSLRSGMTRNGTVYPLQPLALLTDATESGLWPTPRAQDSKHGAATDWELTTDHAGTVGSLRVQVVKRMWPTPNTRGFNNDGDLNLLAKNCTSWEEYSGMAYRQNAKKKARLWPTPTAVWRPMEGNVRILREKVLAGEMSEQEATAMLGKSPFEAQGTIPQMWPTPAARDYRGANGYETTLDKMEQGRRAHLDQLPNAVQVVEGKAIRGTLNPMWVEWLMGFPLGWTDLKPSEMPSSRKYRKSSQGE